MNPFSDGQFARVAVFAGAGLFMALGPVAGHAADSAPVTTLNPTVKLDTMVVTTTPDYRAIEDGWRVGLVPGFRIFSHGNAGEESVARQLQLAREAFGLVWKDEALLRRLVTVVITADEPEFLAWSKLPRNAMDRTTRTVNTPSGTVLLVNGGHEAMQRAVGRGYVLALLQETRLPRWLQEGLAQIVNSTDATGDRLQIGRVQQDPRNQVPIEAIHQLNGIMALDARQRAIDAQAVPNMDNPMQGAPTSQFEDVRYFQNNRGDQVEVTLDGRTANRYELEQHASAELLRRTEERYTYSPTSDFLSYLGDNVVMSLERVLDPQTPDSVAWRMNAWAFTHYHLFGHKQKHRPAFLKFVENLEKNPAQPAVKTMEESLGQTAGKLELNLSLYAKYGGYNIMDFKLAEPFKAAVATISPVPEANVLQLRARVLGATDRAEEARQLLARGYVNPANRTPSYISQFVALERARDAARAGELLEEAARREQLDNPGRRMLAAARLERLQQNGKLSSDDLRMVLLPLFTALNQGDQSEELFVLIGRAWAASAVPPKPEHLNALRMGLTYHPNSRQLAELLKQLEQS
jgi:hypothetical protein